MVHHFRSIGVRYLLPAVVSILCALAAWQVRAEYQAWQNIKTLLPQMIQLLNAHEAALKTQPAPTPAPPQ